MEEHGFRLHEILDRVAALFAPDAALAHPAEGHLRKAVHPAIDPDRARRKLPGHPQGGIVVVARPDPDPTVALSRKIFEAPTQYYKAGIAFLAWLNGHPDTFQHAGRYALRGDFPARRPGQRA